MAVSLEKNIIQLLDKIFYHHETLDNEILSFEQNFQKIDAVSKKYTWTVPYN